MKFSNLTFLREEESYRWRMRCDCGAEKSIYKYNVLSGHAKSCGCSSVAKCRERSITHGASKTPEYRAWCAMKSRCTNPNANRYAQYGGRGIKVCSEWWGSFQAFYEHIGPRPSSKHSLDRINVDGDYEPGNVRWATPEEQEANKRLDRGVHSGIRGVYWVRDVWETYVTHNGVKAKIGAFATLLDAVAAQRSFNFIG